MIRAGLLALLAFVTCGAGGFQWSEGEHQLDLDLASRLRIEWWDAHARDTDAFQALRTRVGLRYSHGDRLSAFAEIQDARIYGLSPGTSGAGALYRAFAPGRDRSRVHGVDLRQLWFEVRPHENFALRLGRTDIKLGTEVMYPEANWRYLKVNRASQRLVGTVGWTHAERSNDGVTLAWEPDGHHVFAFAARPTTGVFDLENAYTRQDEIQYGGLSWTVKRGTWLPDSELRFFGLVYDDERSESNGGLAGEVEIYTVGFSFLRVTPCGPGEVDLLVWGAFQHGDYDRLDHSAAAGILEVGYRFTEVAWTPWLRAGVNVASGDGDPTDRDHGTFFNMLPTNHLYYGFADRFAFQNLVDWFGQLQLRPHPRLGVNLMVHHFQLQDDDDGQYFGTGAFSRQNLGFGSRASGGHRTVATEADLVLGLTLAEGVALEAGVARLWGHAVLGGFTDDDATFGYLQLSVAY